MKLLPVLFATILFTFASLAQQTPSPPGGSSWANWNFLLGEWDVGQGGGVPGQASAGYFSLTPELGGQILLRKNHSEYSSANGKPAVVHDDLMIVYRESGITKALYNDSEGHVIHYNVTVAPARKRITFLSEPGAGQPQYRLVYENLGQDNVNVVFEIAPPDKPDQFKKYVEGVVHRKKN
jgi:hypothetical protein